MKILVNEKRCKRCGICYSFCPRSVFDHDEDGRPLPVRPEACIACRLCEMRCPDFAIQVVKEDR